MPVRGDCCVGQILPSLIENIQLETLPNIPQGRYLDLPSQQQEHPPKQLLLIYATGIESDPCCTIKPSGKLIGVAKSTLALGYYR